MVATPNASPAEAVLSHIAPGADVIVPLANGEPRTLIDVLDGHARDLTHVRVHQMHTLHDHPYVHGAYGDHLRHVSYFLSSVTRSAFAEGGCDLVPVNFSVMPLLLRREAKHPIVLAAASPPDPHGYVSLGTNADYAARFIGQVPFFIEVNPQMPRTFGENSLHLSQVVGWTEADYAARRGAGTADCRPRIDTSRRSSPSAYQTERRFRPGSARFPTRFSSCCTTIRTSACTPS